MEESATKPPKPKKPNPKTSSPQPEIPKGKSRRPLECFWGQELGPKWWTVRGRNPAKYRNKLRGPRIDNRQYVYAQFSRPRRAKTGQ